MVNNAFNSNKVNNSVNMVVILKPVSSAFTLSPVFDNRVVRKLQFLNNFHIKKHFCRAKVYFSPKKGKTCETTNQVVEQV